MILSFKKCLKGEDDRKKDETGKTKIQKSLFLKSHLKL